MNRTIVAHTPISPPLLFKKMQGTEQLSTLFKFNVTFTSKNANIDSKDLIGQDITLAIATHGLTVNVDIPRYLNGLVTDFGYISEDPDDQTASLYYCTLHPTLWHLTQNIDSRVFVDQSVIDITTTILDGFGLNYKICCGKSHRPWGYCAQYQETSFNFLSRLWEQEGIYYYFTHSEDKHTLMIVDGLSDHTDIMGNPILRYHSKQHDVGSLNMAYVDQWQECNALRTKQYTVQEYNYHNAKLPLAASSMVHDHAVTHTEVYEYYAGFGDIDEAQNYSVIRSEMMAAQTKRVHASGTALTVAPGHLFTLSQHPHIAFNTEYLIISADYFFEESAYNSGGQVGTYRIDFTCLPSNMPFRAPIQTPKPQVVGMQAATVTGPAGEEVYTDKYGAIKIQFHWDRYGQLDEHSSNWVRVVQGSAGDGYGSVNTPRIGEEVVVDFINGDIHRPMVMGRVYNSSMSPPWGFPEAAKKSGIKSQSFNSPNTNYSQLMFDDTAGTELVEFQAQKDLDSLIKNNEHHHVQNNRLTMIDQDDTLMVKHDRAATIFHDDTLNVTNDRTATINQNDTLNVTNDRKATINQNDTLTVGDVKTTTVIGAETHTVKGGEGYTITTTTGGIMLTAKTNITLKCGSTTLEMCEDGTISINGKNLNNTATETVVIKGGTKVDIN